MDDSKIFFAIDTCKKASKKERKAVLKAIRKDEALSNLQKDSARIETVFNHLISIEQDDIKKLKVSHLKPKISKRLLP
jgi:hypothetical protein